MSRRGPKPTVVAVDEHHDCAIPDCASWGTVRFVGRYPGVSEHIEGWLCGLHGMTKGDRYSVAEHAPGVREAHQAQVNHYLSQTDGREPTPGNEPLPWGSQPIPRPQGERFVPINRAARRAAAKRKKV